MVAEIEADPEAITLDVDPYVLIRPGGPMAHPKASSERSAERGSTSASFRPPHADGAKALMKPVPGLQKFKIWIASGCPNCRIEEKWRRSGIAAYPCAGNPQSGRDHCVIFFCWR